MKFKTKSLLLMLAGISSLVSGCVTDIDPMAPKASEQSFGHKFYTVACQRVAYSSSLTRQVRDPNTAVDVSGSRYRHTCHYGPDHLPGFAATQDPKVATLVGHYSPMVSAVNMIFPGNELSNLQDYLTAILPLTDNDSFPAVIRSGAALIGELEKDSDLHWSLARLDRRLGYRPRQVSLGLMRELLGYPHLHNMLNSVLDLVGEGGAAHGSLIELMEALSLELRSTIPVSDQSQESPIHPGTPDRTLRLLLDLLLTENAAFTTTPGDPIFIVKRDWRGVAQVKRHPQTNAWPQPFIDQDGDGMADIDPLGSFVSAAGSAQPTPMPFRLDPSLPDTAPKRDAYGRALDMGGNTLFDYINLDATLMAALGRDLRSIMDPVKRTGTRLLFGVGGLMGPRKITQKTYPSLGGKSVQFEGYDTAYAPLLDMIHGFLQVLRDPGIDDTLDAASLLLDKHENETARVLDAAFAVKDLSKEQRFDSAKLDPTSNLFDDLIQVVIKIAKKDNGTLLEDLITALADPRTKNLGGMFANYMKYRDVHLLTSDGTKVANPTFSLQVDRSKPDTGHDRSIQQRLNHIINNTHGMKLCNKNGAMIDLAGIPLDGPFAECELFEITNGALFYTESIARLRDANGNLTNTPKGHLRLKTENMNALVAIAVETLGEDTVLGMLGGIDGLTSHPTTEALNRLMFLDPLPGALAHVQGPAVDIDGHQVSKYHIGSLLSWEVPHPQFSCQGSDPCQFYDAMRPIIQAFADHNSENLFLDVLSVLHRHWASPQSGTHQFTDPKAIDYATGSTIVSYEPMMVEILAQGDLMPALNALSGVLNTLKLSNGGSAKQALARALAFLVDPERSVGLTYRSGRNFSMTTDGQTTVPGGVSPFYLIADGFAAKRAALDGLKTSDPLLVNSWNTSTSDLVDLFLGVVDTGAQRRFSNPRVVPAGLTLVDFLRKRIKAHRAAGDVDHWLGTELPRSIEEKLSGPVIPRTVDFLRHVEADDRARDAIYGLVLYLVDELSNNAGFRATVTALGDMAQLLLDDEDLVPVLHAAGKAAAFDTGLVKASLRFLGPAVKRDTQQVLATILRNAYQEHSPGKSPMQTLLDLITEIHRQQPGVGTPYSGPDFQEAFKQAREFLGDQRTGLEKFFEIVKLRCGGPCPTE